MGSRNRVNYKPFKKWIVAVLGSCVALSLLTVLPWVRNFKENRYDRHIASAAGLYGVPAPLIKAVIWKESGFDSRARGTQGEFGLMQLMDFSAQSWADSQQLGNLTHDELLDPKTNILAGCFYLSRLSRRYVNTDNPLAYALADYNAGRGNVLKWMKGEAVTNSAEFLEKCEFPSTRAYVQSILRKSVEYRTHFD